MLRKEIEKKYLEKINKLKQFDKAYFEDDDPIISDRNYDIIKQEILDLQQYLIQIMKQKEKIDSQRIQKLKFKLLVICQKLVIMLNNQSNQPKEKRQKE